MRSVLLAAAFLPANAFAGEVPLYQPAPTWVTQAALPAAETTGSPNASLLVFDMQQHIADGQLWQYIDTAVRATSPQVLAQLATVKLQWAPDKGDAIVHELSILRGAEKIDLLAAGKKLEVLRREENLEQRMLTGVLTATAPAEGLRVGDVLRLRYSVTVKDAALRGNIQTGAPVLSAPMIIGSGRLRILWPAASEAHWQLLASGVTAKPVRKGSELELTVPLPAPKQPDMPEDAPMRFRRPPLFEFSTFGTWADVSKTMAPLYATGGLIEPASPLSAEVEKITGAEPTQLGRAARALRLVQDQIRYLALAMNGGNYVPQKPADTWRLRYGDCKAKTLLLLAMLRAMNIKAEPVLASAHLGDLVPTRIPSAAAFDHVLVRAEIDGKELWLDGTRDGTRREDVFDVPPFRNVLPLREAGAELLAIAPHREGRPTIDLSMDVDESTSVDLPSVYDATAVLRGPAAAAFTLAAANLDAKRQRELVQQFFMRLIGGSEFSDASFETDADAGTTVVKVHAATTTPWKWEEKQMKRGLGRALAQFKFAPNRAKTEWAAIPVATPDPVAIRYRLKLRLPDGGKGYTIEGATDAHENFAGHELERSVHLQDGLLALDERFASTGAEIPAANIAAELDRVAIAKSREPKLIAPATATRHWNLSAASQGATQLAGATATFDKAIANDPNEAHGYVSRASFRKGIGDFKDALADYSRAIALAPTQQLYLQRAIVNRALGDLAAAVADAQSAHNLDPSKSPVNVVLADFEAERGNLPEAMSLLDQRIAQGGKDGDFYREAKAAVIGSFGNPTEALALLNELMEKRPGSPTLLNASCWIKGTRDVMLDSAVKDCTSAIELSSSSIAALDSRSVVWFRLGRYEDALRDLNAVLDQVPGMAQSRYMRGVVLARMHRPDDSAADFRIARQINPAIASSYDRYGIKP